MEYKDEEMPEKVYKKQQSIKKKKKIPARCSQLKSNRSFSGRHFISYIKTFSIPSTNTALNSGLPLMSTHL